MRPAAHRAPRRSPSPRDRKSTRLNSSHILISYAVFCLKKKERPCPSLIDRWISASRARDNVRASTAVRSCLPVVLPLSYSTGLYTDCVRLFFFNDPAPPEFSPLPLHAALPI